MPVNPYNKYIKQYQTSNITTATPEKLMIMLFDGAIQFLQKAKTAIEEKNYSERALNIENARKIIRELMRTIDLENGNDVSKNLFRLYNNMAMNLIKANVLKNSGLVDNVIEDLTNIRWGFQKAIEIQSGLVTVEEALQESTGAEQKLEINPNLKSEISENDINSDDNNLNLNDVDNGHEGEENTDAE
ncbi:MAG: flagellar export chaperone FliS [bacterium]|nr:flagellar export chaperone FliS [bacterium]